VGAELIFGPIAVGPEYVVDAAFMNDSNWQLRSLRLHAGLHY